MRAFPKWNNDAWSKNIVNYSWSYFSTSSIRFKSSHACLNDSGNLSCH